MSAGPDLDVRVDAALAEFGRVMRRVSLQWVRIRPYFEDGPYDPWRPNAQANINTRCSVDQIITGERYPCPTDSLTSA